MGKSPPASAPHDTPPDRGITQGVSSKAAEQLLDQKEEHSHVKDSSPAPHHTGSDADGLQLEGNTLSRPLHISQALKRLKPHDHLCLVYKTHEEWRRVVIPFIKIGLEKNEKCVYITDTHSADEVRSYLSEERVNVCAAEHSGQLVFLHESEAYTRGGTFDPDTMIALLVTETEKALSEGYSALRATGEMSWVVHTPHSEKVVEYEAKLNRDFFPHYPCVALCQYDQERLDPDVLKCVLMTHPLLVRDNRVYHNFYYISPEEFLSQKRSSVEVHHWLDTLEHEHAEAEIRQRTAELEVLNAISETITQSLELKHLLDIALKKTLAVLSAEGGLIYLFDESSQTFSPVIHHGLSPGILKEVTGFKMGQGLSGHAAESGEPIVVPDLAGDPRNISPTAVADGWRSLVSVPLKAKGNPVGVMTLTSQVKARFGPETLGLLAAIGNQIGVAIENAKLYEMSQRELAEKKLAEEALRESEKKYRDLVENINDIIFVADRNGKITYVSPVIKSLYGYDPSEVIGRSFTEFIYPENKNHVIEMFHKVLSGELQPNEYRVMTKSGHVRWVRSSSRPIFTDDTITGVQGVLTDVTERKQAEGALQESEQKFRSTVEQSSDGIVLMDEQGIVVEWNKGQEQITGLRRDEVVDKPLWDIQFLMALEEQKTPEKYEETRSRICDFLKTGQAPWLNKLIEREIQRPDGKRRTIQALTFPITTDRGIMVGSISRDITEQKQAEEELMQLSTAVRMSNDSIIITDMKGIIVEVNDAATKMYGVKRKDLIGNPFFSSVAPENNKKVVASFEEVVKRGFVKNSEYDVVLRDGSSITVETNMALMKTAFGDPKGVVAISRDITQRKQTEKEMKRQLMKFSLEEGNLYLVKEHLSGKSMDAFKDLINVGYYGLVISRTPRGKVEDRDGHADYVWVAEHGDDASVPPNLTEIEKKVEALTKSTAILIERLDYLKSKTQFAEILSFVQNMREIAYLKGHVIILSVDPSTLKSRELRQLEKEAMKVEPLHKAMLPEDLFEILRVVYEQDILGVNLSYTDVGERIKVSKPTGRKRIRTLIDHGYLKEVKKGRSKVVALTEKGRSLFLR